MCSHVIAGHVRQAGGDMLLGALEDDRSPSVARRQRASKAPHAKSTAQVETVEVSDLAVASVTHLGGDKECARPSFRQSRKKAVEPGQEIMRPEDTAHAFDFRQRR